MVLLVESLHLRTGDQLYLTLAKRWSKVMIALFAVGVVTGTILSFEMGLLWPNFMATYGDVFGLAFGLEGFSFFVEAIFIAIYVYGWGRMSPRLHLLSGVPIVVAGFTGSLFVLSVNAWMNNPSGFRIEDGRAVDVRPWEALFGNAYLWPELTHMYLAAFIVTGFLVASAYALGLLRGRRGRYERTALVVPLTIAALAAPVQLVVGDWIARTVGEQQPTKLAALEGLEETTKGAPIHVLGWYDDGEIRYGIEIPKLLSLLAAHDPDATIRGLEAVAPDDRPPVNVVRIAFQVMVGIGTLLAALSVVHLCDVGPPPAPGGRALVLVGCRRGRPAVGRRAAGRLGHDGGRAPAVGGLRRDAYRGRGDRGRRRARRLRDARGRLPRARGGGRLDPATARRRPARARGRPAGSPAGERWPSLRFPPS